MHNVLDDVVDKEAGAKPKLVGPSGGVGSAVRHISQDELDAYLEGRLSGARLDYVRAHLDACEACRAELEDLRTFKASAVGLSQASSLKRELERRQRQRQLKAAATAAIAAAVVAAIGVVGWNKFGQAWVHTTFARPTAVAAAVNAQVRSAAPATNQTATTAAAIARPAGTPVAQPHATALAATATNVRQAVEPAHGTTPAASAALASTQTIGATQSRSGNPAGATSPQLAQARSASSAGATPPAAAQGHTPTPAAKAAAAPGSTSFALLGPFGDEVSDDRPEFAWQPLEGATKYAIIIVDEGLRPIAHTRLKTTTWRPHKPLRRGRTYLWQVTAILKNGTKVMATGPTSQEARIHITAPSK
jgi:anti-sigma factor RsiW